MNRPPVAARLRGFIRIRGPRRGLFSDECGLSTKMAQAQGALRRAPCIPFRRKSQNPFPPGPGPTNHRTSSRLDVGARKENWTTWRSVGFSDHKSNCGGCGYRLLNLGFQKFLRVPGTDATRQNYAASDPRHGWNGPRSTTWVSGRGR